MHRSGAAVALSGTLPAKSSRPSSAARCDAIELFENDFVAFEGSARELRAIAADLGLGAHL